MGRVPAWVLQPQQALTPEERLCSLCPRSWTSGTWAFSSAGLGGRAGEVGWGLPRPGSPRPAGAGSRATQPATARRAHPEACQGPGPAPQSLPRPAPLCKVGWVPVPHPTEGPARPTPPAPAGPILPYPASGSCPAAPGPLLSPWNRVRVAMRRHGLHGAQALSQARWPYPTQQLPAFSRPSPSAVAQGLQGAWAATRVSGASRTPGTCRPRPFSLTQAQFVLALATNPAQPGCDPHVGQKAFGEC